MTRAAAGLLFVVGLLLAGSAQAADIVYSERAPASGHTISRRAVDQGDGTFADKVSVTGGVEVTGGPITPVQDGTLFNSQTTGAANTAVTVTIAAAAVERAHLYAIEYVCSAGTAALTVQDGATTIYAVTAGTTRAAKGWNPGLTGSVNTALTITLAACGVGNTGTLQVQADRF